MTPAPRIGTEFAGYRIEGLIGRGGMGVVYRAEHPRLGATIALKVMAPELAMDEGFRERFVREARLAAGIKHPNIVPIYDAGEWQGDLYIAMRYIEGDDLRALLGGRRVLPFEEACAIGLQVAGALDAAHRSGLVHRDVKPENILLDTGSEPIAYLADLGLTKQIGSEKGVTSAGELVGTIDYMAPEQISGEPVDGRADVYSLACVLFECLTGSVPYRREAKAAVLWAHLNDEVPRATAVNQRLPGVVDQVFFRGMAKNPEDRFSTGKDLLTALSAAPLAVAAAVQGPAVSGAVTLVDSTADSRPSRRIAWMRILGAAAAVALLIAGAVVLTMALDSSPKTASSGTRSQIGATTPRAEAFSPFDQALLRYVPDRIRPSCQHAEPEDQFDAAVSCRPGGVVRSVTYSHATSGQYLYAFMAARRAKTGLNPPPVREGRCSAGQIPSINDTVAIGWRGRAETTEAAPHDELLGRILCSQSEQGARIEWLTQEPAIFAIAQGNNLASLYEWWATDAGPEP